MAFIAKKLKLIAKPMDLTAICPNALKASWLWVLPMFLLLTSNPGWAQGKAICPPGTIPRSLVYAEPGDAEHSKQPFAVIVDKSRQTVVLYRYEQRWQEVTRWPCSTGKHAGPKTMEGDRKTPEGVYFVTREVGRRYLSSTYGSRALPLDYPNWLDRQQSRTGSAIWLHGTNKTLQARDSNGCVVLENSTIDQLAGFIHVNHTPVIIVQRIQEYPAGLSAEQSAKILTAGEQWHAALMSGSYQDFRKCYAGGAAPGMRWWQRWCRQRRRYGIDAGTFRSIVNQRAIYRSGKVYVLLFDHLLQSCSQVVRAGRRKLYLNMEQGRVLIAGDPYQITDGSGKDPLFTAWYRLWRTSGRHRKVVAKVNGGGDS